MQTPVPRPDGPKDCQFPHTDGRPAPWTIEWVSFHPDQPEQPFVNHRLHTCHAHAAWLARWAAVQTASVRLTGVTGPYDDSGGVGGMMPHGFGNESSGVW